MRFAVRPLAQADAEAIAAWRYPGEYAFYDFAADPGDLALLLDPAKRGDAFHAADGEDGRLAGFFQAESRAESVELGLGLRPDLCGRGLGGGATDRHAASSWCAGSAGLRGWIIGRWPTSGGAGRPS